MDAYILCPYAVGDPLLGLGGKAEGGEWAAYYEGLELVNEIKKDLERLYPTGIGTWMA